MLLILSFSLDTTVDLLLEKLVGIETFRFNIDLWNHYTWRADATGFTLWDPTGRICSDREVTAVYFRKLIFNPPRIDVPENGSEENWRRTELELFWKGIRDWAHETGRLALVMPAPTGEWGKIRQMRVAARWFHVPEWRMFHNNHEDFFTPVVVKTQGAEPVGRETPLMVRRVDPRLLSHEFPWFIQKEITDASHDVTVVWVSGRMFAYELDRSQFTQVDCRESMYSNEMLWRPCLLSQDQQHAISNFMNHTGMKFGRLDFLRMPTGLTFLEVNPNGQYAWLDMEGTNGLLDAVVEELIVAMEVHVSSRQARDALTHD